ncbi:MAG: hypothetical protein U1B83_02050, partial [Candidatus Cloacimonadaceae bacterium]|nr:hypothetical protein [Candidatus Cloacimonadaceae bacterium]
NGASASSCTGGRRSAEAGSQTQVGATESSVGHSHNTDTNTDTALQRAPVLFLPPLHYGLITDSLRTKSVMSP